MIPEYLDIPLFPLPNVTLFPKTPLPLHIFEPRYRTMIDSCLNGDRMLGIALLREGWQKDYFGRPPIHKTLGVGKIIDHEQFDDGRYNILVEGLYRVRLITEYPTESFRTARVSVLQDAPIDDRQGEVASVKMDLHDACQMLCELVPEYRESIQGAWAAHIHPGVTSDLLATTLVVDAYDRQSILEVTDPLRRLKLVLVQVKLILYQLTHTEVEEEVIEED